MSALPLRRNQVETLANSVPAASGKETEVSEPAWVETPTSTKIMAALEFARTTPTIAIVFGAAGCSKTTAARRYTEDREWGRGRAYYVCAAGTKKPMEISLTP